MEKVKIEILVEIKKCDFETVATRVKDLKNDIKNSLKFDDYVNFKKIKSTILKEEE